MGQYLLGGFLPASCVRMIAVAVAMAASGPAAAWERGLNAGSWTKGVTLNVFVDATGAPDNAAADIAEAVKEWNDAQAPFGGLKLVTTNVTKANADIHISWQKGGSGTAKKDDTDMKNNGFTKETVRMMIDTSGNDRGTIRELKHEFGHAEGLGHSANSALMRENAYSKTDGAPKQADLNSADPFIAPTADDKAGKKTLWGTIEKLSKSTATSSVSFKNSLFTYNYLLTALNLPGLTDPVTEFALDLPTDIQSSDFAATNLPNGWDASFFDGFVIPGGKFGDDGEGSQPSVESFDATSPSFGLAPGQSFEFDITSPIGPGMGRAFTNSPSFDSDEFSLLVPAPEPGTLALLAAGLFGIGIMRRRKVAQRKAEEFLTATALRS